MFLLVSKLSSSSPRRINHFYRLIAGVYARSHVARRRILIDNVDVLQVSIDFSDEEYGQKSVSVMLDGQETELEIIDHPAAEMSVSEMRYFHLCS